MVRCRLLVSVAMLVAGTRAARAQAPTADPPPAAQAAAGSVPVLAPTEATASPALPTAVWAETPMIHKPREGLVIAGAVTFTAAYAVQELVSLGIWLGGVEDSCSDCSKHAALWSIPIAGPWIGGGLEYEGNHSHSVWPYVAWSGIEAAGVAMVIAGWVGHDVPQAPIPGEPAAKLTLVPVVTPQGGTLTLGMSW